MVSSRQEHDLQQRSSPPSKGFLRPAHILRARNWDRSRGGSRKGGKAAYDDYYFSFEGKETVEVAEVSLGFCFSGHDCEASIVIQSNQQELLFIYSSGQEEKGNEGKRRA